MSYDDEYEELDYNVLYDRMVEDTLRSQSEDAARWHLATVGDAIETRVRHCLDQAQRLKQLGFNGPSVVASVSAIELIIRFLLIKPLVSGAFLSGDWAELLMERIGSGSTAKDREILPKVLSKWGFNLDSITLQNGEKLWSALDHRENGVLAARNRVVHQAVEIDELTAQRAIDCVKAMIDDLVRQISRKFRFTLERTGCWHKSDDGHGGYWSVLPRDPLELKKPRHG